MNESKNLNPQNIKVGDLVMNPKNTIMGIVYRVTELTTRARWSQEPVARQPRRARARG